MSQSLGQVIVREHGREPLAHQLLAPVAGDVFRGVIHGGKTAVRIERHDGVGRRLHQVPVARFRARQGILRAFGIGDIAERGDGADDLAVYPEWPARHGDVPLFAGGVIHDAGLVALRLPDEDLVLA